jgi:hypothetical protein
VVFQVERYVEAMFYADDIIAYPNLPTEEQAEDLRQQGYHVFIFKDGKLE